MVAAGCGSPRHALPKRLPPPAAPLAVWPWPDAVVTRPTSGVTCWTASSTDGAVVRLIRFDFQHNPRLHFDLYDQSLDHPALGGGGCDCWPEGVWRAAARISTRGRRVVAAWNGLFFSIDPPPNSPGSARLGAPGMAVNPLLSHGIARHVAPCVVDGVVRDNVGNPRWTFGAATRSGRPRFQVLLSPDRLTLARTFTVASGGAQCLILDGRPQRLGPTTPLLPANRSRCRPDEAGRIALADDLKTSRVGMGWTRDSGVFYLLVVRQSGTEEQSAAALATGGASPGGWNLADEQRFWSRLGAWDAVNSDGGGAVQLALVRPDGRYDVLPAAWATSTASFIADPRVPVPAAAPLSSPDDPYAGGTLMYFTVTVDRTAH
ncbi:MAG: hypothetical protein ACLQVD_17805 [Capsulimonadaceae bacterium]